MALAGGLLAAAPASASAMSSVSKPGAPRLVVAAARDGGAVVGWKPPSSTGGSPVTGYVITASPGGKSVHTSAVTRFLVAGLANGTAYRFTVAAVNKDGTGPASSPSAAVTPHAPSPPGPPRSVAVTAGFEQVSVSWAAPTSDGGAPVSGYRLTTSPATPAVTVAGDARSATLAGLANGTAYKVLVTAVNSAGRGKAAGAASATPHVTVPAAPAAVTAAPASSGVQVSWQPPASDGGTTVTGYVVTVTGTTRKVTATAGATSVTVTGLTSGTSYTFGVAASNGQGRGPAAVSSPATAGGTVAAKTVVLSAASLAALTQVGTDGSLIFTSPPAQVQNLAAGDIVTAGVSTATPQGLLAKVTTVSAAGSTVTVGTVQASLDQALSAAGFGTSSTLTQQQLARFIPARAGVNLLPRGQAPASAAQGSISLSLDTTLYKSADGRKVTVGGSVSVSPSVSFHASITCCVHTASQFTGSVTASAALAVNAQVSHDISGGYTLGTLDFTPITVDVLGVPVVITPQLTVSLLASGSVTAGLTAGAGESVTLGAQVTTKNATVTAHPSASQATTFTPPTVYGSLDAAAGVGAQLSTRVDGLPGPSVTDSLWLAKLAVDPSAQPWWTLSLENVLHVDYQLSLLHHSFASYHATLSDATVRLAQATSPYQGITITPSPAAVAPGGQIQLHAQVAGVAAQKVTWNTPTGNGTITPGGLYTAPGTPGTYQVTAESPASGLKPQAAGLTSIQVGDQPPGPPTSPSATSTSYGAATVTWQAPADAGGGSITGYTITAHPGGNTYPSAGTATSDTIGGLSPGASYTFTITASSGGGTSIPSAPTNVIVIDNVGGPAPWVATEAPLPANASPSPDVFMGPLACPSTTSCVAVGQYVDSSGNYQGFLVTGSGSSWTATEAPLPAGASADPDPIPLSVACSTSSECVAVGYYTTTSGSQQFLLTGGGSSWTASVPPLPAGAFGGQAGSVACAPSSGCAAVGSYIDASGKTQGLLVTGSGSSWTATQAPLPANASSSDPLVDVQSVACPSASACVAAGYYTDNSGTRRGLLLTGSGSSWTATQAPLPANADSSQGDSLYYVACATGSCTAAGYYTDSSGTGEGLLLTGSGTSWTAAQAPLPANADQTHQANGWYSVACASSSACAAVGSYGDKSGNLQGWLVSGPGSSWTATEAPLPANATSTDQFVQLNSVACPAVSECVAVGYYNGNSPNGKGLLLSGSGSSWAAAETPLPANVSTPGSGLDSVTCPSTTSCVAVGEAYDNSSPGQSEGFLVTGPG